MKHRGEIVENAVRKCGISITKVSEMLNISRKTLYNKFEEQNLDLAFIKEVGAIIHFDFAKDFPELLPETSQSTQYSIPEIGEKAMTLQSCRDELVETQRKYIALLEFVNKKFMNA